MIPLPRAPRHAHCVALLLLALAAAASADDGTPPRPDGMPPRGPPPEAIAACSGQAAEADCRFTDRSGTTRIGRCLVAHPPPGASDTSATSTALACDDPSHPHGPPPGEAPPR